MKPTSFFRKHLANLIFFVLSLGIFITFLNLARYALPKTDDFAYMMYGYQDMERGSNVFTSSWNIMKQFYMGQQGNFTSVLSAVFLLIKTGTNLGRYQLITAGFVVLSFLSYMWLMRVVAKHFHFEHVWGVFLFAALWVGVDVIGAGEPILYIVGACVYIFPLALGFLSTICFIKLMETDRAWAMVLFGIMSAGLAFFAAGGVLMVAAMINIFMVWIICYERFMHGRFPFRGLLPCLFAFAGALMNALAPGNFTRYTSGTGDSAPDYLGSIVNTLIITCEHLLHVFTRTYFLVALVLVTVAVVFTQVSASREQFRVHPLVIVIANFISCYLVVFPTVLGYHLMPGDFVEERIQFTFAWIGAMLVFMTWIYTLMWVKARHEGTPEFRGKAVAISAAVLVVCVIANILYVPAMRPEGTTPTLTTIYNEVSSGALENYYAANSLALRGAVDTGVGNRYYIFYEIPETKLFMGNSFSSDDQWWVNRTAAAIYRLAIFAYCPEHPFSEQDALDAGYTIEQLLP